MNALLADESLAVENENGIELRVLLGAQVGSSLTLSVGEYVLGCSDECAIILTGRNIEPRHAVLRFDGKTAWIEPFEGSVRGKRGEDINGEQELELGTPVQLGNVVIAVDYEQAPWPEPESVVPGNHLNKHEELEDPEEQDSDVSHQELASEQEEAHVITPTAGNPGKSRHRTQSRKVKWLLTLLLTAGISVTAGIAWFKTDDNEKDHNTVAMTEEVRRVEAPPAAVTAILAEYSDDALAIKKENGQWEVSGYVSTSVRQRGLAEALAVAAPDVHVKVFAENALAQSIKNLLDGENLDAFVRLESVTQGVARLSGAAASSSETEHIVRLVTEKVPGIVEVKADLLLPDQLRKVMRTRIAAARLGDRLINDGDGQDLKLTGRLTQEEIRRWEELLVGFTKDFGKVLAISATITRVVPKPPIGVQVIVGGAMPYIVTESGEHVNQGGYVDGHTLMSIKEGEVVFEGSQRIRIAR